MLEEEAASRREVHRGGSPYTEFTLRCEGLRLIISTHSRLEQQQQQQLPYSDR